MIFGISYKKFLATFIIIIYSLSIFFYDFLRFGVSAEDTIESTNLVAIFVDEDIYDDIENDIERYASDYIQGTISNTKAIVYPINTTTFKAQDITKMLENMYFDWIEDQTSKLLWTILIWDIPLPVVLHNWYIFPSIYPYVDFEDQQYIYDATNDFFVLNENSNNQAEIRHGIINFDQEISAYDDYFAKLRSYDNDPVNFIGSDIWYDDFIGLQKYFQPQNLQYYANKFIFAEDVSYRRFSNFFFRILQGNHFDTIGNLANELDSGITSALQQENEYEDEATIALQAGLESYADEMKELFEDWSAAAAAASEWNVPTLVLQPALSAFFKTYDELFGNVYKELVRDNSQAGWRRFVPDIDTHIELVQKRDDILFGDLSNLTPMIKDFNDLLEKLVNEKVEDNKYYMHVPLALSYKREYKEKALNICQSMEDYHENHYFWKKAQSVNSIEDLSIYKWTRWNLSNLDNQTVPYAQASVGSTYNVFNQQTESNRWYNYFNIQDEYDLWENTRIWANKEEVCNWFSLGNLCITWWRDRENDNDACEDADYAAEEEERPLDFAVRLRGWASPLVLVENPNDSNSQILNLPSWFPYYKHALQPISDLEWTRNVISAEPEAHSTETIDKYWSLIRVSDQAGTFEYPRCIDEFDRAIDINGIPFAPKFIAANQSYFSVYNGMQAHVANPAQIVMAKSSWSCSFFGGNNYEKKTWRFKTIDSRSYRVSPTPTQINSMNIVTADRPIDNVRYINFQWLDGELIELAYPNLYNVAVYSQSGDILTLKDPEDIQLAIQEYLRSLVEDYNDKLNNSLTNRLNYYNTNPAAFNLLAQHNSLATPNRTYNLLDTNLFVDALWEDNIALISELMYYQNIARREKQIESNVSDSILLHQDTIDINAKIVNTLDTYLRKDNDQWPFITPDYKSDWYEAAYINTNGNNYIANTQTPNFITALDNSKDSFTIANSISFMQTDDLNWGAANQEKSECGYDPASPVPLQKRPSAVACWLKLTLKKPFSFSIEFPTDLTSWEWVLWALEETFVSPFTNFGSQMNEYGVQWDHIITQDTSNAELIASLDWNQAASLQSVLQYTTVRVSESNRYVDPNIEQEKTITINGLRDNWDIRVTVSVVWDNCLAANWYSNDFCNTPWTTTQNLIQNPIIIPITLTDNTAGMSVVDVELCLANSPSTCVHKTQTINLIPWAVDLVEIQAEDTVIAWAQIPFAIGAIDAFDNVISQTIDTYRIVPSTGTVSDGNAFRPSIVFSNFEKALFVYQAPVWLPHNTPITLSVINDETEEIFDTLSIRVVEPVMQVEYNDVSTNTINYTLPSTKSVLYSLDENNIIQINEDTFPRLRLILEDIDWETLSSPVTIQSQKWLFSPWILSERNTSFDDDGTISTVTQIYFSPKRTLIVQDGILDVYLEPSFVAGEDTLSLSLPGRESLIVTVNISPWDARVTQVDITTQNLWEGTSTTWNVVIQDIYGNIVTDPTMLRVGAIWPAQINGNNQSTVTVVWWIYEFTLDAISPGGVWYVYSLLDEVDEQEQQSDYSRFIVQKDILPQEDLNVMYLTLLGSDWWNQRWYFSSQTKDYINGLIQQSDKLLTATTQLINLNNLKQTQAILTQHWQIKNINNARIWLSTDNGAWVVRVNDTSLTLGSSSDFTTEMYLDSTTLETIVPTQNTIYYIPNQTDSFITSNTIQNNNLRINWNDVISFDDWSVSTTVSFVYERELLAGYTQWSVLINNREVGTLVFRRNDTVIIQQPLITDTYRTFAEWSTNGIQWIAVTADIPFTYEPKSYTSAEDSHDETLWIAFTAPWKVLNLFAAGQSVGDASKSFASPFVINIGDPVLQRIDQNRYVENTNYDWWMGELIYSDPSKTIQQTIPFDFNNDGLDDLLIVHTDWSIKLLKNYWGSDPYKDLGNLMLVDDTIKEVHVGDVDGNNYNDIIVWTNNNQLRVYRNDEWIFDVDGNIVCLDVAWGPDNLAQVHQIFFEDMDADGSIDIITNDWNGDIKIFYGWENDNGEWNYISTLDYTCDTQWSDRQEDQQLLVKRFGIELQETLQIVDSSIVRWNGLEQPAEDSLPDNVWAGLEDLGGNSDDTNTLLSLLWQQYENEVIDSDTFMSSMENLLNNQSPLSAIENMDLGALISQWAGNIFTYIGNPFTRFFPSYEANDIDISYVPIEYLQTEHPIKVYKQYADVNWWILQAGDIAEVTVTFAAVEDGIYTFADSIEGPWIVETKNNGEILSFDYGTLPDSITMHWNSDNSDYQYIMDTIVLAANESVSYSYTLRYRWWTPMTMWLEQIQDPDYDDTLWDITVQPQDACSKYAWEFLNQDNTNDNYRSYDERFVDIQAEMNSYYENLENTAQENISATTNSLENISTNNWLNSIPGISSAQESRNTKSILEDAFNELLTNGQANINMDFVWDFIDDVFADVSAAIDGALNGMCQWFNLGWWDPCLKPPVPFNMAFLSPGTFNIFGCTLFQDKWLPLLFAPATLITPVGPMPSVGPVGLAWPTDTFYWAPGWTYPSMIRLYISPTLTAQLGLAICLWPMNAAQAIPQPFRDMWGNCIVIKIPMPSCGWSDPVGTSVPTAQLEPWRMDAAAQWTCQNPPTHIPDTITWVPQQSSSPFQLVGQSSDSIYPSPVVPAGTYWGGLLNIDTQAIPFTQIAGLESDFNLDSLNLAAGSPIKLKIEWWNVRGIAQCIVQKRLDNQIAYVMSNLTQMTVGVFLPDPASLFDGLENINTNNLSQLFQAWQTQEINRWLAASTVSWFDKLNAFAQNSLLQQWDIANASATISNPFEVLSTMFNDVNLINFNTKDVSITVPMIYSEDIIRYNSYLENYIEENEQILIDRTDMVKSALGVCSDDNLNQHSNLADTFRSIQTRNVTDYNRLRQELATLQGNDAWEDVIAAKRKEIDDMMQCYNFTENFKLDQFFNFQTEADKLIRKMKQNLKTLEMYQQFPLELYAWLHVTDRYLTNLSSMISNFLGTLGMWLDTNAKRFSQYVDSIITLIGVIKTRQALIDFSVNWNQSCATCSNDNYDYYSCSLSFLCPDLPVLPLPPFKLPNIYLDLSRIDIWIDILLPTFKFSPTSIPLPRVPNLPRPPSAWFDFNLDFWIPEIPDLPMPPQLPTLPMVIPQVKLDLPVLPPAPKIPKLTPQIQWVLKAWEFIGKILCIVKWQWVWLVAEDWVKSKIEQMTQRSWNVPFFDFLDLTEKSRALFCSTLWNSANFMPICQWSIPPAGFDYQIDSFVRLQFNFDHVYSFVNTIAARTNSLVDTVVMQPMTQAIDDATTFLNNNPVTDTFQDIENFNVDINVDWNQLFNDAWWSYGDSISVREDTKKGIRLLQQHAESTAPHLVTKFAALLHEITLPTHISPNHSALRDIDETSNTILDAKQQEINTIKERIQNDYDWFLQDVQNNTIQLVSNDMFNASLGADLMVDHNNSLGYLQKQENPIKSYIDTNKNIVDWYVHALDNNSPETLWLSYSNHRETRRYLWSLQAWLTESLSLAQKESAAIPVNKKTISSIGNRFAQAPSLNQRLISQNGNEPCINCTDNPNQSNTDLSQYVQWIFVEWDNEMMVNVVVNDDFSNRMQENHILYDINDNGMEDIILWDDTSIYVKFADQDAVFSSDKTRYHTRYYLAPRLQSPNALENISNADGYIRVRDIDIKVYSTHREVKNFRAAWQNFDSLSFGRTNSSVAGDNHSGYLMQLNHRIDTTHDKGAVFDFMNSDDIDLGYILVLPTNTATDTMQITLPGMNTQNVTNLLTWTIFDVKYYDPENTDISVVLTNLSRKRKYSRIATLTTRDTNDTRYVASPWSNQIVVGMQLISDDLWPEWTITLYRPATDTIVSTGSALVWYVSTSYNIDVLWEDNVAVAYNWIEDADGNILATTSGNSFSLENLYYTENIVENYVLGASDYNGNSSTIPLTLTINIPDLEIVDITTISSGSSTITATISHDVDEWYISFENNRNDIRRVFTGVQNNNDIAYFPLSPTQTILTGWIFDTSDTIWLYNNAWEEIALLYPQNGQIELLDSSVELRLDMSSHTPLIRLIDTVNTQILFTLHLPTESLATNNPLQILQPNSYELTTLDENFGDFAGGSCIQDRYTFTCIAYINEEWFIYIPSPYNTSLAWTYSRDWNTQSITYTITDSIGSPIAWVTFMAQNLFGTD